MILNIKQPVYFLLITAVAMSGLTDRQAIADIAEAEAALQFLVGEPEDPNCKCSKSSSSVTNWSSAGLETSVLQRLGNMGNHGYQVQFGDTLDSIIKSQLPDFPVKKVILRDAIVAANSHAFRRNNPHWLYANKTLKLPTSADIHQAIFKTAAPDIATAKRKRKNWISYP
ncbi:MAG: hypothetical protein P8Q37_01875 [Porticoccaceae bacterium]|nr:hypothetical protein [Porticoccaceae bacterium]MDG1473621.1 hypothetical protein [Porticoccaceae bacterium]